MPFPALLDEGEGVGRAYEAFPQRLVVVGRDGQVVHGGGRGEGGGPSDWDLGEVEQHLRAAIAQGKGTDRGR